METTLANNAIEAFPATTLTTSYAATQAIALPVEKDGYARTHDLYFTYVVADSTTVEIYPEYSLDNVAWHNISVYGWSTNTRAFRKENWSLTAADYTTTGYPILQKDYIQPIPAGVKFVRFQIKKTGGVGVVTLAAKIVLSYSPITDTY